MIVTLLSGGLDSTTLMYHLKSHGNTVHALTFNYGQRHFKELVWAHTNAKDAGVPYKEIDMSWFSSLAPTSSQTSPDIAVPEGHYTDASMKTTVVPNRNAIMLSIATAYAISNKGGVIAYAAHSGDHAIYPDCRRPFVEALQHALNIATEVPIVIYSPFLDMTKGDIVKLGAELKVPFENTWSCYKGGMVHCGKCGTCVERREAFVEAGVVDPTVYEA